MEKGCRWYVVSRSQTLYQSLRGKLQRPKEKAAIGKGSGYARRWYGDYHSTGSGIFCDRTYRRFLEALDGKYLKSFLAHARRRVVTSPPKSAYYSHTSLRPSPFHPRSELHFTFWKAILTERWPWAVVAVIELPTWLDRLGKAFSVVQTSHLSTLFRAGVTGVSVKHGHVSMC